MLSWFNILKKGIVVKDYETWKRIFNKYNPCISDEYFDKGQDLTLGLIKSFFIPQSEIAKWDHLKDEQHKVNEQIRRTAELNNKGADYEKTKEIDKAIECYEENLTVGRLATFSYDRLIILYRKRKQYLDELRILDLAIDRFGKGNEERYRQSMADPKNRESLSQLETARELNSGLKDNDGWYIFSPYPIIPWIARREKVLKRIEEVRNRKIG